MKRRKFLQGLFATAIAAPVIAKAVADEPFSETVDGWVPLKDDLSRYPKTVYGRVHADDLRVGDIIEIHGDKYKIIAQNGTENVIMPAAFS